MDIETRCKHGMIAAYCAFERPAAIMQNVEQAGRRRASRPGRRFQKTNLTGKWSVVGFLAARATIYINAKSEALAAECEAEYLLATGEAISVHVTPKWGHAVTFEFYATDFELVRAGIMLEQLAASTRGTPSRKLSNAALGWALFALGFRAGKQDVERIRMSVPATPALAAFDRGVGIGRQS